MEMWKRAEKKLARLSEGDPVKLKLPKLIISKFKILFWVGYYRILSFKRPGRLYIFFDFGMGVYWRGAFIQKA